MKIAILGIHPNCLDAAIHLHDLGAAVTLFTNNELSYLDEIKELISGEWNTSEWAQNNLQKPATYNNFNEYYEDYFLPMLNLCKEKVCVKDHKVLRVQKRFLGRHEEFEDHSRLVDLFKVVYEIDPKQTVEKQKETNLELFKDLDQEVVDSLDEIMEGHENFDIVIDGVSPYEHALHLGEDHLVLNENKHKKNSKVIYGHFPNELAKENKEVAIVGNALYISQYLYELKDWLMENDSNRIFWVSKESEPTMKLLEGLTTEHKERFAEVLTVLKEKLDTQVVKFEADLDKWNLLEDYEKAKISKPEAPIPQLVIFSGHDVTSIDSLSDHERLFLTIEKSDFRECFEQKENGTISLKTIGADQIISANGHKKNPDLFSSLQTNFKHDGLSIDNDGHLHNEPGFFTLPGYCRKSFNWDLDTDKKAINKIEQTILKYFSRVE